MNFSLWPPKNDVNKKFAAHKFGETRPQWKKSGENERNMPAGSTCSQRAKTAKCIVYVKAFGSLHLHLNLDKTSCRALEMRSMLCSAFLKSFSRRHIVQLEEHQQHPKTGDSWAPCLIKCVNLGKSCRKNPNENRNVFPHIKHFGLGPKLGAV